jgi:hypothetical protein
MTSRTIVQRRAALTTALAAVIALLLAAPALAGTWYIQPTIVNNSQATLTYEPGISGVDSGNWITSPNAVILPGQSDQIEFNAPYYDEGAGWQGNYVTSETDYTGTTYTSQIYIEVDDEFETGTQYYCLSGAPPGLNCGSDNGGTKSYYAPTITITDDGGGARSAAKKGKRPRHHLPVRNQRECPKADRTRGFCRKSGLSPGFQRHI